MGTQCQLKTLHKYLEEFPRVDGNRAGEVYHMKLHA